MNYQKETAGAHSGLTEGVNYNAQSLHPKGLRTSSESEELLNELSNHNQRLFELVSRLDALRDRIKGSRPEAAGEERLKEPTSSGFFMEAHRQTRQTNESIHSLETLISELEDVFP